MSLFVQDVDFLFIYEIRTREIDSICLLGAWLEKQGYKVGYINTWDSMYHWHPEYRTKVAVLSACYTSNAYKYFLGHAVSFEKAVNLQWEQVMMNVVKYGKVRTGWDFIGQGRETRLVCWGEDNKNYLQQQFGIADDKLRICGYIALDFYRNELRDATEKRETLFARYGLDPAKKTLLFISSFGDAGKPKSEIALQDGDPEENEAKQETQATNQKLVLEWFRRLAEEDESLQVIYRPHPAEANNPAILDMAREIPNFYMISGESIRNWIINCDVMLNWQSTAMIELYAAKKKTLILRPQPIPFLFSMPMLEEGHYQSVTTYEELVAGIREPQEEFPVDLDMLTKFYSMTDQPVYERVGQYLIDSMNDPDYTCPPIGEHTTPKGRVLHRAQLRLNNAKTKLLHGIYKNSDSPKAQKIAEEYKHNCYYEQKMKQNRTSLKEIRAKIDAYKRMIGG